MGSTNETALLECLEGEGSAVPSFPDLDQHFRLKARSYVDICMPPVFGHLARVADLYALRREGIYPIMFYLSFAPEPLPLAFGAPVRVAYRTQLHRYRPAAETEPLPGAPSGERLLIDNRCTITGNRGRGRPDEMDSLPRKSNPEPVGTARIVQVFTRLLAPPGQRQVRELPPEFRIFREHPWTEPYPAWEGLKAVPAGFEEVSAEGAVPVEGVWGLPNTDINQHVTLTEYIGKVEDQLTGLQLAAGLPFLRHRVRRVELLFMKPFFAGERYRVNLRLWRRGEETLMLGALHKPAEAGAWPAAEARPAVFARFEGCYEGEEK